MNQTFQILHITIPTEDFAAVRHQGTGSGCGIPNECKEYKVDHNLQLLVRNQAVQWVAANFREASQAPDYELDPCACHQAAHEDVQAESH